MQNDVVSHPPTLSTVPAISVIIPMYNVEKYIGEMLDSLLYQTFEEFEVILVDDRSTDNSFEVAKSYVPKFDGRLTLFQLDKNSGGAGEPRNVGLTLSRGEYVIFMDADDFILLSALETLYKAAKKYDADVVYSNSHYDLWNGNDAYFHSDSVSRKLLREGLPDKPTLTVNEPNKPLDQLLLGEPEGNICTPWTKLVHRELLIENKITFPLIPNCDDFIWVINVYSYARRFLRIQFPFYFYRHHDTSLSFTVREPTEQLSYWVSSFVAWAKALNELENRTEILKNNPEYCFRAASNHFVYCLTRTKDIQKTMTSQEIYEIVHREFQSKSIPYDMVLSVFFSSMDAENKIGEENSQAAKKLLNFLTARIDIKFLSTKGDFKILSVSDNKATVWKPGWMQTDVIGYQIQSYVGELDFVAKSEVDGQVRLWLRGMDVHDPKDDAKRIPYWINFTNFVVNGETIFDKLTPAWHDESYIHTLNVKGGEEVKIHIAWLNDYVASESLQTSAPAVSVIISMYNAAEYIGECLDSLLIQTLQDFEVIVVDDCSIDNSVAIVNSYKEKFGKRLILSKTKKNSGSGAMPRNIGFRYAHGEYVIFLDSDDFLLGSALETLYNAAKEYDAEVVYSSNYYNMSTPNCINLYRDGFGRNLFKVGIEDKTTLTVNNRDKIFQEFIAPGSGEGNFRAPWSKFVNRDFLIKNKIQFPNIVLGEDCIWCINVYAHANRFLRLPTPLYFYRYCNPTSITRTEKKSAEQLFYWVDSFVAFLKALSEVQNKSDFLRKNPFYCYEAVRGGHFDWVLFRTNGPREEFSNKEVYEILYRKLCKENNSSDLTMPFFFSVVDAYERTHKEDLELLNKFRPKARMDIKLFPKTAGGDFQIVSVSDDKADVWRPDWFQENGIGYMVQFYEKKIELVAEAVMAGKINLSLRGLDVRNPEDTSKRIPHWVDYTKLIINGQVIFDKLMPVWHDKPYTYNLDLKAGGEIKIQAEWIPHMDHSVDVSTDVEELQEEVAEKDILISELQNALDNEKKIHSKEIELFRKFSEHFTARVDVKLIPNGEGKLQIISVSDAKATTRRAGWLPKNQSGYFIHSYVGQLDIVTKPTADGQIDLVLRGVDIRDPSNRSKKIPYWIDYTKLVVNGEIIFNKLTSVWHDKPFRYNLDAKAGEEIKIQTEWIPHKSDS